MAALIGRFGRDQSGVTAIEYSLVAGLISVVIIGAATTIGAALNTVFTGIATVLTAP